MSASTSTVKITIDNEATIYCCDDCDKTIQIVHNRHNVGLDEYWTVIRTLFYSTDEKYYLHFCPDCSKRRGFKVGAEHEKWNE